MKLFQAQFRAMGSPCSLRLYCDSPQQFDQALLASRHELERLEAKYSRFRADSLLSRINASAGHGIEVDAETAALLDYACQAHAQSLGLFDPSAGTLYQAWDFKAGRKPANSELEPLLAKVGWHKLAWSNPRLRLPEHMQLDFGGFVKEYAADAVARLLREAGHQHGLIDLGGDIVVLGATPDAEPWRVGLRDPRAPDQALIKLAVSQGAIASSGDYERFFVQDGVRYCHILNPRTGWPAQGVAGVSVLAAQCLIAGTACTVAMLLGAEQGLAWLQDSGLDFVMIESKGRQHQRLG